MAPINVCSSSSSEMKLESFVGLFHYLDCKMLLLLQQTITKGADSFTCNTADSKQTKPYSLLLLAVHAKWVELTSVLSSPKNQLCVSASSLNNLLEYYLYTEAATNQNRTLEMSLQTERDDDDDSLLNSQANSCSSSPSAPTPRI